MKPRILIIEDEAEWAGYLAEKLGYSYEPVIAGTGAAGLKLIDRRNPNCIILDLGLPDYPQREDLQLLQKILDDYPDIPVVIFTVIVDTSLAVKAAQKGAFDYLAKAYLDTDKLLTTVRNAVVQNRLKLRDRERIEDELANYPLIGESPAMVGLREAIRKVAVSNEPVLITGETGTGKEIVARHLHYKSKRSAERFVVATVPGRSGPMAYSELFGHIRGAFTDAKENRRGKFDLADKGTLFLDDVDLSPPDVQGMLLRILENGIIVSLGNDTEHIVDVRVIASTNKDLKQISERGGFGKDLYYRLSAVEINIPPLRQRVEDIALLARYFLERETADDISRTCSFSEGALSVMLDYDWPGNVRELKHKISTLLLFTDGDIIEAEDVVQMLGISSETRPDPGSLKDETAAFQRQLIERKLIENGKNISKTAAVLGITRQHLQRLMKSLRID